MENQFAKLFNYPEGQLLITIEQDEDDEELSFIRSRTMRNGTICETKSFLSTPPKVQSHFNEINEENALTDFNGMQNLLRR